MPIRWLFNLCSVLFTKYIFKQGKLCFIVNFSFCFQVLEIYKFTYVIVIRKRDEF